MTCNEYERVDGGRTHERDDPGRLARTQSFRRRQFYTFTECRRPAHETGGSNDTSSGLSRGDLVIHVRGESPGAARSRSLRVRRGGRGRESTPRESTERTKLPG